MQTRVGATCSPTSLARPVELGPDHKRSRWRGTSLANSRRRPPADVNWGDGTDDEMCVGYFITAPLP